MVVLFYTEAVGDVSRLLLCKNSRTGIPLFLRVVPVLVIPRQFQFDLACLKLRLLQAEKIRIKSTKILQEILAHHCSQTIYIPGNQLHLFFSVLSYYSIISVPQIKQKGNGRLSADAFLPTPQKRPGRTVQMVYTT